MKGRASRAEGRFLRFCRAGAKFYPALTGATPPAASLLMTSANDRKRRISGFSRHIVSVLRLQKGTKGTWGLVTRGAGCPQLLEFTGVYESKAARCTYRGVGQRVRQPNCMQLVWLPMSLMEEVVKVGVGGDDGHAGKSE
jgi:hypothetical protein